MTAYDFDAIRQHGAKALTSKATNPKATKAKSRVAQFVLIGPTWPPEVDIVDELNADRWQYAPDDDAKRFYLSSRSIPTEIRKAVTKLARRAEGKAPPEGYVVDCALTHALDALEANPDYRSFVNSRDDAVDRDYVNPAVETLVNTVIEAVNFKIDIPGRGKRADKYEIRKDTATRLSAIARKRLEVPVGDLGLLLLGTVLAEQDATNAAYGDKWRQAMDEFLAHVGVAAKGIGKLVDLDKADGNKEN